MFDAQRVIELFSQHLIAAADAKDRRSLRCQFEDGSLQTTLAHPQQVLHGVFGAGQHHHVRLFEFGCTFDIAHRYPIHTFQTVQVGEIGDARQANNRDVQHGRCGAAGEALGKAVLILQIQIHIRHYPYHLLAGNLLDLIQSRT